MKKLDAFCRSLRARNSKAAAMAVCMSLAVSGAAQAAACATSADRTALQMRMLQTELMVAALTCNQRTEYNAFVTRFQPQLGAQGKHLQAYFKQQHGARATRVLNDFITRIANESARRGMVKRGAFCRNAERIYAGARGLKPAELPVLAGQQDFADRHGQKVCVTQIAQAASGAKPADNIAAK